MLAHTGTAGSTRSHPDPVAGPLEPIRRRVAMAALGGGALDLAFWLLYAAGALTIAREGPAASFESAFPVADTLLGVTLVGAGIALHRRSAAGPFFLVAAASMALYLGLLDLTFYLRHDLYDLPAWTGLAALGLNLVCIGGGAAGLWYGWRLWRAR
ncbi:MAG TPA: hypothetical protein VFU00_11050 [Gemmatimonadales bacterium]|nr:hypothetical protein [Gemmatimonadales bacterium]